MRNQAFTIIELLVIIFIIGILASIFGWNLLKSIRSSELRDATNDFAAQLQRARSQSQRNSLSYTIAFPGNSNFNTYTVIDSNNLSKSYSLQNNVSANCSDNCDTNPTNLIYTSPYGELGTNEGMVITLNSPMAGITPMEIRIVGVTGKIIITKQGS